jgi:hypothetical protein
MLMYVDPSVVGGCEDPEFAVDSRLLWQRFVTGEHTLVISELVLRELQGAPPAVQDRLLEVPEAHQLILPESREALQLADAYLAHGVLGKGSRSDAEHVALATAGRVDVLVSWNFKHMVNLGRIRGFNAVNLARGYGILEIRSPKEVMEP